MSAVDEARALLEQTANLLKQAPDEFEYASDLVEVLAERMDYPDPTIFRGAYTLVSREEGIRRADWINQAMLDAAEMTIALSVIVEGCGDGRDAMQLHYRLDAIEQRLIGWGRELAEGES